MASFAGTSSDDLFLGTPGGDQATGAGGNDVLAGAGGSDALYGGDGDDWLYSADRSPAFTLPYDDPFQPAYVPPVLDTGAEPDALDGGAGDDRLFAGYGDDVDGGGDTFTGDYLYISFLGASAAVDFDFRLPTQSIGGGTIANVENLAWVQGSNYDDTIVAAGLSEASMDRAVVFGMGGNDSLTAGLRTGYLDGGDGNDVVDGRASEQLFGLKGGAGDDILYDSASTFVDALGGDGNDTIHAHHSAWGGSGNDTILLEAGFKASARGESGNDDITANDSGDWISGGSGADVLRGGAGDDNLAAGEFETNSFFPDYDPGADHDVVTAGGGSDLVSIGYGDDADGGTGTDVLRLSFAAAPSGITFNSGNVIAGQTFVLAGGGIVQNFERVRFVQGSAFADIINIATQAGVTTPTGSWGGEATVDAGDGDDMVRSNASGVIFNGGNGDDTFFSGTGADTISGGAGMDTVDYGSYLTGVTVTLTPPQGAASGRGPDGDVIALVENVAGSNFGDSLTGDGNSNSLSGRAGNDTLDGRAGNDTLDGGSGADSMTGGTGDDIYYVDDAGDSVNENPGEGTDEIRTSLAVYSLAGLANVENLTASDNSNHDFRGNSGDNVITGGGGNDTIRVYDGGNDTVHGGAGDDLIFIGAALTSADVIDGGADIDTLIIQGNYPGGLTLTANVTNIENLSILNGANTSIGASGTELYDYVITTNDANFAAGLQVRVNAGALLPGEDFTFNGSAETNAGFVIYGGRGKDTLTGGLGNDIFFFAEQLQFAPGDTVNGGAGYDSVYFRGNYTIDFNAPGYAGQFNSIESITLTSASDTRYARGGPSEFDYSITLADANLAAGVTLTINGTLLQSFETMVVDGSQETDGFLRIFAGFSDDTIKGGGQDDLIHGNFGADTLTGGGGADTFRYQKSGESTATSLDHILDFTPGTDKIELTRMDANTTLAGNQDFHWIGSNAFAGTGAGSAGELRAYEQNGTWFVQGDTNGDGTGDFLIALTLQGATALSQNDFFL